MEAVDEFEAERDQQRDAEQQEGRPADERRSRLRRILLETKGDISQATCKQAEEKNACQPVEASIQLWADGDIRRNDVDHVSLPTGSSARIFA